MSAESRHDSPGPGPERDEREPASHDRPPPRARTRTIVLIGIATLALFLVLLALGVVPRVRNQRELAAAARKAQTTVPEVQVVRPEPASTVIRCIGNETIDAGELNEKIPGQCTELQGSLHPAHKD